jgi:hypothetical protein
LRASHFPLNGYIVGRQDWNVKSSLAVRLLIPEPRIFAEKSQFVEARRVAHLPFDGVPEGSFGPRRKNLRILRKNVKKGINIWGSRNALFYRKPSVWASLCQLWRGFTGSGSGNLVDFGCLTPVPCRSEPLEDAVCGCAWPSWSHSYNKT